VPSQFIAPATIQPSVLSIKASRRNFGGEHAYWTEWQHKPGDVDPDTVQSALGAYNADGEIAQVISLGQCQDVVTRVRCEHWCICKAEGLERCYKGDVTVEDKRRRLEYQTYVPRLLESFRQAGEPITFSEIARKHGVENSQHPEYQQWRGAFYHACRTGKLIKVGKKMLEGRTHSSPLWVVKE
jgi:hypothetical protein